MTSFFRFPPLRPAFFPVFSVFFFVSLSDGAYGQPGNSLNLEEMVHLPFENSDVSGSAVFDFDRDGDLDLYLTRSSGVANSLYSNQLIETGKASFVDVAMETGVAAESQDSGAVCYGDLDNDGDHDVLVLSRSGSHRLFENQLDSRGGLPTFLDISAASGVATATPRSFACAMGDVDGDGLLDLVIGRGSTKNSVQASEKVLRNRGPNPVLLNQGGNIFIGATVSSSHAEAAVSVAGAETINRAVALVDIDQDGDVDLLSTDDPMRLSGATDGDPGRGAFQVFENDGSGVFGEFATKMDWEIAVARGTKDLAFADPDHNGLLDVLITRIVDSSMGNPYREAGLKEPVPQWVMQRTNGTFAKPSTAASNGISSRSSRAGAGDDWRNTWVQVEVRGSVGLTPRGRVNRDGIGAVVRCFGQETPLALLPVFSSSSHATQRSLIQSCDLGNADQTKIEVLWPGGVRNRIYDVEPGERLLVPEIPCSYDDSDQTLSEYRSCVRGATSDLEKAGAISSEEAKRSLEDAERAYLEAKLEEGRRGDIAEVVPQKSSGLPCMLPTGMPLVPELITYPSSITNDLIGPLDLNAELNYDPAVMDAPIVVVMHGFSFLDGHFDNVRGNAQHLRDAGFFAISVAMRQRELSDGVRDSGGVEIYDIYDAVEYVKENCSDLVDPDNVHITGYSGGGGNVMSALTKFPDYFRAGSSFFGMSDYGFDPQTRWYDHGAGDRHTDILDIDVGVPDATDLIIDKYSARASNRASKNNPYSEIHLFVNSNETTSPQLHHDSYLQFANDSADPVGEFANITVHVGVEDVGQPNLLCEDFDNDGVMCEFGEVQSWVHGFPNPAEQTAAENWYLARLLPGCENLPAGCILAPVLNTRDELYVAGFVETKPFTFWLGDGQSSARDLSYILRDNLKQFSLGIPEGSLFDGTAAVEGVVEMDTSSLSNQILQTRIDDEIVGDFLGGSEAVYAIQDDEKLQVHLKNVPIANWKLNETEGTVAFDSSINGRNGDLEGSAFDFANQGLIGKVGGGLEFDGSDDRIDLGTIDKANPLMLAGSDFTISAWIQQADGLGERSQRIVDKSDAGNGRNGYTLWVDRDFIGVSVDKKIAARITNPGIYDRWYHLAVTMTADEGKIYLDGDPITLFDGVPALPPDVVTDMHLGRWNHTGGKEFKGLMDDVRIYNYALAEEEVKVLQTVPPIGHWKLDETTGTVARDASDYDFDGDLEGDSTTVFDFSTKGSLGSVGRALEFDGDDDLIELGVIDSDNPLMLADSDFTISVWVFKNNVGGMEDGAQRIVDKSSGSLGLGGYALWLGSSGLGVSVNGDPSGFPALKTGKPNIYGRWYHIAVTMTSTIGVIYVDGVPQVLDEHHPLLPSESEVGMRIGSWNHSTAREFKGLMDDLRIYNYALDQDEVMELLLVPPVAHWSLDETTGTVAGDLGEFQNHGDLIGPSPVIFDFLENGGPGEVGRALTFDGLGNHVEVGTIDSKNPLMLADSEFSIAVWIYQEDGSGDGAQRIVDKSNGAKGLNGYSLWIDDTTIGLSIGGDTVAEILNPGLYNQWVHLAVTMAAGGAVFYVAGELEDLEPGGAAARLPNDSDQNMRIGTLNHSSGREFEGMMDDLRIYNRVLSMDEVKVLAKVP